MICCSITKKLNEVNKEILLISAVFLHFQKSRLASRFVLSVRILASLRKGLYSGSSSQCNPFHQTDSWQVFNGFRSSRIQNSNSE